MCSYFISNFFLNNVLLSLTLKLVFSSIICVKSITCLTSCVIFRPKSLVRLSEALAASDYLCYIYSGPRVWWGWARPYQPPINCAIFRPKSLVRLSEVYLQWRSTYPPARRRLRWWWAGHPVTSCPTHTSALWVFICILLLNICYGRGGQWACLCILFHIRHAEMGALC